jgi:hypothetical protein
MYTKGGATAGWIIVAVHTKMQTKMLKKKVQSRVDYIAYGRDVTKGGATRPSCISLLLCMLVWE